jgi:hypothetical protein
MGIDYQLVRYLGVKLKRVGGELVLSVSGGLLVSKKIKITVGK